MTRTLVRILSIGALVGATLIGATAPATAATPARQVAATTSPAATACRRGSSSCPIRITFAKGAYTGQASSSLTGVSMTDWFVVHARKGQAMIVVVEGAGATRGIVHFPNGHQAGQPGGRVYDDITPATGDYRIAVTESSMGQAWRGAVTVIVVAY